MDISGYNTLVFGYYSSSGVHTLLFRGNGSYAINNNGGRWVFVMLVKKGSNTWDAYYREYRLTASNWVARTIDTDIEATNLSSLPIYYWTEGGAPSASQGMTELYAM